MTNKKGYNLVDSFRAAFYEAQDKGSLLKTIYYPHQKMAHDLLWNGELRKALYICWCRRAGKDIFAFSEAVHCCLMKKNSRVLYIFPTAKQGKENILDGVTFENGSFIASVVSKRALKRPKTGALYHHDNKIRFKNGSTISFVGDDANSLVGGNLDMLVVSETAMVKKATIDYLVPSILKSGGKIICISTPRFGSHFNKSILENEDGAIKTLVMNALELVDNNGDRIYSDDDLVVAQGMMSKSAYRSEYMCDLASANATSIYGESMDTAKWIKQFDYSSHQVFVAFDLGHADNTAMTFGTQMQDGTVAVVDQYRKRGQASQHYIDYLENWLSFRRMSKSQVTLIFPHDANQLQDAGAYLTSRVAFYEQAGFKCICLSPISVLRGIEITRASIETHKLVFFDNSNVHKMTEIVKGYEWKVDKMGQVTGTPLHGTGYAASNDADSLEYLCMAYFLNDFEKAYTTKSGVIIRNDRK